MEKNDLDFVNIYKKVGNKSIYGKSSKIIIYLFNSLPWRTIILAKVALILKKQKSLYLMG